ncbi:MAG TPA: hypothetical protein VFT06_11995, partial [Flavisolibacter sp.]|nr:hypothetical protein [Flavisolibacter sp.]
AGVWGETAMPAHPNLPEGDARQIVSWVLSLSGEAKKQKSLPASGTVQPTLDKKPTDNGVLLLSASYLDKGGNNTKPLVGSKTVALRSSKIPVTAAHNLKGYAVQSFNSMTFLMVPKDNASFSIDSIDLTDIAGLELGAGGDKPPKAGYVFDVHLDSPTGKLIGQGTLPGGLKGSSAPFGFSPVVKIALDPVTDGHLHNLYIVSKALNAQEIGTLVLHTLQFKPGSPTRAAQP